MSGFCSFAVPCFVMMSFYLSLQGFSQKPYLSRASFVWTRYYRLVPAYLGWSLVYYLVRLAKHYFVTGTPFHVSWLHLTLFGAASYQLYFVPLLLLFTLVFSTVLPPVAAFRRRRTTAFSMFSIGIAAIWLTSRFDVPESPQILNRLPQLLPYVFLGAGVWLLFGGTKAGRTPGWLWCVAIGASMLVVAFSNSFLSGFQSWQQMGLSLCVFLLAVKLPGPKSEVITWHLAPIAFGIYLAHAVFVEGLQVLVKLYGVERFSLGITVAIIVLSFTCSVVLCLALLRSAYTRWLVV